MRGQNVPKEESEWDENDLKLIETNCKAMSNLICALGPKEFHRVSACDSTKEIWNKLKVTYKGTNQVK